MSEKMIGGLETGGLTFVVSVAKKSDPTRIVEKQVFKTDKPEITLGKIAEWFNCQKEQICSLGIASFGPIDINEKSDTYGYITTTPKENWQHVDIVGMLRKLLKNGSEIPIGFQTDVNAAALAENHTAVNKNVSFLAYITVGGGIGVGYSYNGSPLIGLSHAEGGHLRTVRYKDDTFEGTCKYHGDCVEGLACATSLAKRLGISHEELSMLDDDHEIWDLFSFYLGELCAAITLLTSPEVIVIGGGVLNRVSLFPKIRAQCIKSLAGYISLDKVVNKTESYIIPAFYENNKAGVVGSLEIAANAAV